ncbi:VOC family protein [Geminicoccus roseus]|uniref:VOC family protein n=1 Tax=Geminicoccus roseus TaxID=404900 RepID=UPI000413724E|nr:VOC family protein [Geminicoccus roseus]
MTMQTVTAHLFVKDAVAALDFYRRAFGAKELFRLTAPDGKIGYAEIRIGTSIVMLADEFPDFGALAPPTVGGSPVRLHIYVEDTDAVVARALEAGATLARAVADQFYGDRSGMIVDPFGHSWSIATRIEMVEPAEMQRRFTGLMKRTEGGA